MTSINKNMKQLHKYYCNNLLNLIFKKIIALNLNIINEVKYVLLKILSELRF